MVVIVVSTGGTDMIGSQSGPSDDSGMTKFTGAFDSNSDGLNIQETSHFFERIDYVLYHGKRGIQYSLINPYLVRFTPAPLDYADSNAFEFGLEFQYEKFTVHSVANFSLGAEDYDRFDPSAAKFEGPAHELDPIMEDALSDNGAQGQQRLEFLTPTSSDLLLTRSTQISASAEDGGSGDGTGDDSEQTDETKSGDPSPDPSDVTDKQNQNNDENDSGPLKSVYGEAATFPEDGTSGGLFGESWFGDLLDASLSAAITGADIKDAALGSLGQSAIRWLDTNPDAVKDTFTGNNESSVAESDQAAAPAEEQDTPTRGGGGFF